MTAPPTNPDALNQLLRRVHRGVLATLAVCAVVVWLTTAADAMEVTPRGYVWAAVALAALAILLRPFRTVPLGNPKIALARVLISLLCAVGVGLVGVASAAAGGPRTTALGYALAGAIFALRAPARIEISVRSETS
jgi:FtsH-binding integral membrane protein